MRSSRRDSSGRNKTETEDARRETHGIQPRRAPDPSPSLAALFLDPEATEHATAVEKQKLEIRLPGPRSEWRTPWLVDISDETDESGWAYKNAVSGRFASEESPFSRKRKRKWVRECDLLN